MKIYRIVSAILALALIIFTFSMMVNAMVTKPESDEGFDAFGHALGNVAIALICLLASVLPFILGTVGTILTCVKVPKGKRAASLFTFIGVALVPAITSILYLYSLSLLS